MKRIRQAVLTLIALTAFLAAPLGTGTASARPDDHLDSITPSWVKVRQDSLGAAPAAADNENWCIPVKGPGVKMTFYCNIVRPSTLWVYCQGVTIEIPLPVGRWAPSGSCPGYRGYRLAPR